MYSSAVFAGGGPLCTQILPRQGRPPSTILGIRKLDTVLPNGEDHIPLCSLVFYTILECNGQMDGRICRSIYSV